MPNELVSQFSREEKINGEFMRIARNVYDMWKETGNSDIRLFQEQIFPYSWICVGSKRVPANQGTHYEYVVPIALIRDECHKMFCNGKTIKNVAIFLCRFLRVVCLSTAQKEKIDIECNLKQRMPDGWSFESGDVFVRLRLADIKFVDELIDTEWPANSMLLDMETQVSALLSGLLITDGQLHYYDNADLAAEVRAQAQEIDAFFDPRAYAIAIEALNSTGSFSEAIEEARRIIAKAAAADDAAF